MGMKLLLGLLSIVLTVLSSCPPQYVLIEDQCVMPIYLEKDHIIWDDVIPDCRSTCSKDGARLPIIRSYPENEKFNRIANSYSAIKGQNIYLTMDMVCNHSTKRLNWVDGSSIEYIPPPELDKNFDCTTNKNMFVSRVQHDDWYFIPSDKKHTFTVLCVRDPIVPTTVLPTTRLTTTVKPTCPPCPACPTTTSTTTTTQTPTTTMKTTTAETTQQPVSEQCGDYEPMPDSTDAKNSCIKLVTERQSWEIAQKTCAAEFGSLVTINSAEENKFFWRTAVSNNLLDGIHIGAHQSSEDPSVWTWIDGEVPISGKAYDNFIGYFPIPGAGECASMLTESSSALWINEDCNNNKQPFFCRREDFSDLPKTCPKDAPKAGEDIISPGFPNSDIPCEYVLFVSANKLVEIEILALVTDVNNDFIEIFEGPSGPNLIASLTGKILSPNRMRTAKSNVMRVNWIPNGKGINRGFKIRYYEVDP